MSDQNLSWLCLVGVFLSAGGCGRDGATVAPNQPTADGLTTSDSSPPLIADQQVGTFYLHDFGTVLPGRVSRHQFTLTNPTGSPWTFAKLIPNCSCTVASTSASTIAPGATETVEVQYIAPTTNGDDRRKVGVQFAEVNSPTFWLEVAARVRQPISFFPETVAFSQVGKDVAESFFEVHNYTKKSVQLDPPRCSAPWLEAEIRPIDVTSPVVKQAWRVVVRANTRGLKPGKHGGEVLISEAGADFRKAVPVEVDLIAPVRPIPTRLFFGSLERGKPVEKKVALLLASDLPTLAPADIQIKHDLGAQMC